LDVIDSYTYRTEAQLAESSDDISSGDDVATAVKACRRYFELPEDGDSQEIGRLLSRSPDQLPADETASRSRLSEQQIPPELLDIFQVEAEELIDRAYQALQQLEQEPEDQEVLQDIRRTAHTLKGAAGAVGLKVVTQLSHRMEDLLDALYEDVTLISPDTLNLLTRTFDVLHGLSVGKCERGWQPHLQEIYAAYDLHFGDHTAATPVARQNAEPGLVVSATETDSHSRNKKSFLRVPASRLENLGGVVSELTINRISMEQELGRIANYVEELRPVVHRLRDVCGEMESQDGERLAHWTSTNSTRANSLADQHFNGDRSDDVKFDALEFDRYTRIDVWSQALSESTNDATKIWHELRALLNGCESLLSEQRRLTEQTQERLTQIQMVEFGTVMPRLRRAVREVASSQAKNVEFIVDGADVEMDKIVLEESLEMLLHLVRNAVDHGIEMPDERVANGKPLDATVRINLVHFGTRVVIQFSDDGRGIDAEKIRRKIISERHLSQEDAQALTSQQVYAYLFKPGFSTASAVSEYSGRGVGMDVVRSRIEELKGKIEVDSIAGKGTKFTIHLPVGQAVTRALILNINNQLFALPQRAVTSILRLSSAEVTSIGDAATLLVGEDKIPLINLASYFGAPAPATADMETMLVAILGSGAQQVALQVEGILPGRDIVLKDLGNHLTEVPGFLGSTVLGDGKVVPILEPTDLIAFADISASWESNPTCPPPTNSPSVVVMIVDDSVSVRGVMRNIVEHAGWTAVTARDGVDALQKLGCLERRPDVFLLDVEMPRMNGYELISALRQQDEFEHTPIIMITSRTGEKHRQKAIRLGASAYITKPFHDQMLIKTVHQHLV
jgi:chemosensory pili system protein ChpA (sensor histidine kinase/response regulator)